MKKCIEIKCAYSKDKLSVIADKIRENARTLEDSVKSAYSLGKEERRIRHEMDLMFNRMIEEPCYEEFRQKYGEYSGHAKKLIDNSVSVKRMHLAAKAAYYCARMLF